MSKLGTAVTATMSQKNRNFIKLCVGEIKNIKMCEVCTDGAAETKSQSKNMPVALYS
jgi:hypothetical protein